jgi:hypothetical protein
MCNDLRDRSATRSSCTLWVQERLLHHCPYVSIEVIGSLSSGAHGGRLFGIELFRESSRVSTEPGQLQSDVGDDLLPSPRGT